MNHLKRGTALLAALALGGCTIVRPLIDREMARAPHAACAAVNGEHPLLMRARPGVPAEQVEAGAPSQCFALHEEGADGRRGAWSGGPLRPGRTLIAILDGGDPDCKGRFTHLIVSGGSAGAGQLELATWDLAARPGHMRRHRWERGFASRTLGLASLDTPTMAPVGARIRVLDGSFDPAHLCFKSY